MSNLIFKENVCKFIAYSLNNTLITFFNTNVLKKVNQFFNNEIFKLLKIYPCQRITLVLIIIKRK